MRSCGRNGWIGQANSKKSRIEFLVFLTIPRGLDGTLRANRRIRMGSAERIILGFVPSPLRRKAFFAQLLCGVVPASLLAS
jgi:hypothetical protein